MAEFQELIEDVREDISIAQFLQAEAGERAVRASAQNTNPKYLKALGEAAEFVGKVMQGRIPMRKLAEALTTSDFPVLFGDVMDRVVLADYRTYPSDYRDFLRVGTVRDFRQVERYRMFDGDISLVEVPEHGDYAEATVAEGSYTFKVRKFGRAFKLTWETFINDDSDALRVFPQKLSRAAILSEQRFASSLYVANATLFNSTHGNAGTAELSIDNLIAAYNTMVKFTDQNGEPIMNMPRYLVVPPALAMKARQIVGSNQVLMTTTANVAQPTSNPMYGALEVKVDPFMPVIDSTNGHTSWYLIADPAYGAIAEVAFLSGYEDPQLYQRNTNATRLGGTDAVPMSFADDTLAFKVRHVFGGMHSNAVDGWKFGYWSTGAGSGS